MDWNSILGLPISATMPLMKVIIFWISASPVLMAFSMVASSTSLAPASIMTIFSALAATVSCRSLASRCFSVGFTTSSPSTRPMNTPAMGPFQGMSEMESAMDVPIMPAISGLQSWSTLITVITTETSFRMSLGNSGRMGRSTTRLVSTAFSPGRPSRRMKLPGMRPTEYSFSSKSTERGKKSMPSRGLSLMVTLHSTAVSP